MDKIEGLTYSEREILVDLVTDALKSAKSGETVYNDQDDAIEDLESILAKLR